MFLSGSAGTLDAKDHCPGDPNDTDREHRQCHSIPKSPLRTDEFAGPRHRALEKVEMDVYPSRCGQPYSRQIEAISPTSIIEAPKRPPLPGNTRRHTEHPDIVDLGLNPAKPSARSRWCRPQNPDSDLPAAGRADTHPTGNARQNIPTTPDSTIPTLPLSEGEETEAVADHQGYTALWLQQADHPACRVVPGNPISTSTGIRARPVPGEGGRRAGLVNDGGGRREQSASSEVTKQPIGSRRDLAPAPWSNGAPRSPAFWTPGCGGS